jgi:hypothetical protein
MMGICFAFQQDTGLTGPDLLFPQAGIFVSWCPNVPLEAADARFASKVAKSCATTSL